MARKRPIPAATIGANELRIIGGRMRGRKFAYHGDAVTRPMKERVREAAFNLIGPAVKNKLAVDLFAGTGALGLEALSRGARGAVLVERHLPTIRTLRENVSGLEVDELVTIVSSDTFFWARSLPDCLRMPSNESSDSPANAWLVFCSPPYALYHDRQADVLQMIERIQSHAPIESIVVVEADSSFDFGLLPAADAWDVRAYDPAVLGIWRKDGV